MAPAVLAADLRCYYRGFMVLRNPQLLIPWIYANEKCRFDAKIRWFERKYAYSSHCKMKGKSVRIKTACLFISELWWKMKDVKRVLYNISVNALKTPPLKVTHFAHLLQHSINILHIFHRPFNRQIDRGIWVKDRRKINLSPSFIFHPYCRFLDI